MKTSWYDYVRLLHRALTTDVPLGIQDKAPVQGYKAQGASIKEDVDDEQDTIKQDTHALRPAGPCLSKTRSLRRVLALDLPPGIPGPPDTTNQRRNVTTRQLSRNHTVQLIRVGSAPLQPHCTRNVQAAMACRKGGAPILPQTGRRSSISQLTRSTSHRIAPHSHRIASTQYKG